jgi:hypothetical protein
MWEDRNAYRVSVRIPEGNSPHSKPKKIKE